MENIIHLPEKDERKDILVLREKMEEFQRKCQRLTENTKNWTLDCEDMRVAMIEYALSSRKTNWRISLQEFEAIDYISYLPFFWSSEASDIAFLKYLTWVIEISEVTKAYLLQYEQEIETKKKEYIHHLLWTIQKYGPNMRIFYREMIQPDSIS